MSDVATRRLGAPAIASGAGVALAVAGIVAPQAAHAASDHTVTTNADSGAGSLRDALASAEDGDVITFASSVTGSIDLQTPLEVTHSVAIEGPGADALTIDGQDQVQDLVIDDPNAGSVSISGLTLAHGKGASGGALEVRARTDVYVSNARVRDSTATVEGGGIFVGDGSLSLSNSTVSGNTAPMGGGIFAELVANSAVLVQRSTISGNAATAGEGGGVYVRGASVETPPTDSVTYSCPSGTTYTTVDGYPRCEYAPTSASSGYCPDGGQQYFGPYSECYTDQVVTHHRSPGGYAAGGTATISISTVADNQSPSADAAVYFTRVSASSLIGSSTIASNAGGGVAANQPAAPVALAADIVAGNTQDCATDQFADAGYNVDSDGSCGLTGTGSKSAAVGIVAALGPLHDNGGPVETMALALSSDPAAALVPSMFGLPGAGVPVCGSLDERGVAPAGTPCAAGAFQIEAAPTIAATVKHISAPSKHGKYRKTVRVTFHCQSASPEISVTCPPPSLVHGAGEHTVSGTVIAQDGRTSTVSRTVHVAVTGVDRTGNRVTRRGSIRLS